MSVREVNFSPHSDEGSKSKRFRSFNYNTSLNSTDFPPLHFYNRDGDDEAPNNKVFPRFFLISHASEEKDLSRVSPFLVQKTISYNIGNVTNIKKLRGGKILVEVSNESQAKSIQKLTNFSQDIPIKVEPHPKFNTSKGVVSCMGLIDINTDDILNELKEQNVSGVHRITRKVEGEIKNTPTLILTFNSPDPPLNIKAGFYSLRVNKYIPSPSRCFKCQVLGHFSKFCKSAEAFCGNCGLVNHCAPTEICERDPRCRNCDGTHPSWSKKCPVFLREKEIMEYSVREKVSVFIARKIKLKEVVNPAPTFANAIKAQSTECKSCIELREVINKLNDQIIALTGQVQNLLEKNSSVEKMEAVSSGLDDNDEFFDTSLPNFLTNQKVDTRNSEVLNSSNVIEGNVMKDELEYRKNEMISTSSTLSELFVKDDRPAPKKITRKSTMRCSESKGKAKKVVGK